MALSQHDLLRLMESLRTADGIELMRVLAQRILQELLNEASQAPIRRRGAHWRRTFRPR